jgi:hypothetical protein
VSRPLAWPAVALAVTLSLAACGGGDVTGPAKTNDIPGVYPLRTYDGAPVPLVVGQNATQGTLEITGGHVTLKEDGSFRESMTYRLTPPSGPAVVDSLGSTGHYTVDATRITFTFPEGDIVTGRYESSTITVAGEVTFVYRR